MSEQMRSVKQWLPLFLILLSIGQWQSAQAQYFDFEQFSGKASDKAFPPSLYGNENATIKTMYFGKGDTLWIGTYKDGLLKWWQEDGTSFWWQINELEGNEVYHFAELEAPVSFFTDYNSFTKSYGGLYRLNSRYVMKVPKLEPVAVMGPDSSYPFLPRVNGIHTQGDSLVLLATDSGLVMFDGYGKWRRRNKGNITNITEWKIEHVTSTSTGGIYLSSGNNIYRKIGNNWQHFDLGEAPAKLKNTSIKRLRTGPNDTIWAITGKGIAKIHGDTIIVLPNDKIKPILNEVKDVVFDNSGYPWMIFELNGGLRYLSNENGEMVWHQVNSTNSPLPDELSAIAKDGAGHIWLGTDNSGLFKFLSYTPGGIVPTAELPIKISQSYHAVAISCTESQTIELAIYTISGKQIINTHFSGYFATELPAGTYLVKAESSDGSASKVRKFVIY
ncbi:T9SS type A sorting domain-containing protein [bacterium]|nr:T9SS type A sorting domain-containing protein [bacterium]